jgi:hypothetical protein
MNIDKKCHWAVNEHVYKLSQVFRSLMTTWLHNLQEVAIEKSNGDIVFVPERHQAHKIKKYPSRDFFQADFLAYRAFCHLGHQRPVGGPM